MLVFLTIILSTFLSVEAGYNGIVTSPRCYSKGICTAYGRPGTNQSWHENAEERLQRSFVNAARMFPSQFVTSPWGKYSYGTYGPTVVFDKGGFCGKAAPKPFYFYADATEAARWNQWDCSICTTRCGHNTCAARTHLFGGKDDFGSRAARFVDRDGARASAEGLCGANMCYTGGHCSAMFDPDSTYIGIGFWPVDTNGVTNVYVKGGPAISYPIPSGSHFDQRIKTNARDYYGNNKHMVFNAQYWKPGTSATGYVAYQGRLHQMTRKMGRGDSGFWELAMPVPTSCEPYYFVFKTSSGQQFRFPEDSQYMFGTEWSPWSWWTPPSPCGENHYLLQSGRWLANSYTGGTACKGCSKAAAIQNL